MKNKNNLFKPNTPPEEVSPEELDPKQQAIKYKTFRHIFSEKDINKGLDEKTIAQKLKKSKHLEESYIHYVKAQEKNPSKKMVFPWDSFSQKAAFWTSFWAPRLLKWMSITCTILLIINYIPGPTQHIVEVILARAIYDTSPIQRLPDSLETYAHSASIVDNQGAIIKSYGKREVTTEIPDKVRKAILACEDHYFLPHPNHPWYINSFLIHSGVSWPNIFGALKDTLQGKRRGASTIVMQNAKKILGNQQRTISHKLEEIIISYMMISRFGKEKNLDFYINTVPVGNNIYGFKAASQNYFKKDLNDLTIQQLVAIGSFIPNHNRQLAFYKIINGKEFEELSNSYRRHALEAVNKINLALSHLHELGEIDSRQYEDWRLRDTKSIRKIGFRNFRSPLYGEEEWTSWNTIRQVCSRSYTINGRSIPGAQLILDEKGDVVIETGVDLILVEKIKEIISEHLSSREFRSVLRKQNQNKWRQDLKLYESRHMQPPYSTFNGFMQYLYKHINVGVIIINKHGNIIAYVGGKEFFQGENDETVVTDESLEKKEDPERIIIDLMNKKATLTPSSTIKPIIAYYSMVAGNADLDSHFTDKPMEYKYIEKEGKKIWLPRNWYSYDERGKGHNRYLGRQYSLMEAQVLSVNTIFARLYSNRVIRDAMLFDLNEIGLDYNRQDARYWPFGIGASDVPVQQWVGIYSAFLDGYYREPSFVKNISVNGETIYDLRENPTHEPILLFDSEKDREAEMLALYEVCNRGTGAFMKTEFPYHKNLVSGKTGTAPNSKSSLFISHFNPYHDRNSNDDQTITMLVAVTTNTGGHKSVGSSTQGPVKIAGKIYNFIFQRELKRMMDEKIETAKRVDPHFKNNHLYWANVNRHMEHLLQGKCRNMFIHENIIGVDGFEEALEQILNSNNKIYSGRDDLFEKLVDYYCDQSKVVRLKPGSPETEN